MKRSLFTMLLIVPVFVLALLGGGSVSTNKEPPPLVRLQASESVFADVLAMTTGTYQGQQRFYVFHSNNIIVYNEERRILSNVMTSGNFDPKDPVADSRGNVYLINTATDEIGIINSSGQWSGSFRVQERPYSLARLSDGNLVIASPNGGRLLHVYDTSGHKLRSIGDVKLFDATNQAQNLFLNRGKVVVDSSDNIYFVFKYAPTPTVLKFSKKGQLISEFAVEGEAIDLQAEPARKYLSNRPANQVGGFVITNSAAIDPLTGHLWVCMNGSSRSGLVYEYSPKGKKLREYSFVVVLPAMAPLALTYVTDVLVRGSAVYITVGNGVYSTSSDKPLPPGDFVSVEATCPQEQSWPGCAASCPQDSCPTAINCKAILQSQIAQGLRIVGSSCQSLGPGQGTPAKPNGGCVASVTTCDTSTGTQVTHTTNQDCNPVKYSCSGGNCVVDCNGTYTTSNCNNACTGGGPSCEAQFCDSGCSWSFTDCCCVCGGGCYSPILVDILGNGFDLTDAGHGVYFDMDKNGIKEHLSWTSANSDDAFLALDRNGNATVDDGTELFGNLTPQPASPSRNGFIALAEFDKPANGGNGDGRIDSRDAVFLSLRLWQDTNHNGISEPNELHTLPSLGVTAIDLDYKQSKRTDQSGNLFKYRAKVYDAHDAQVARWAWDVFFVKQ